MTREVFTTATFIERLKALPTHVVYGQLTGSEEWGDNMARYVPEHMREGVVLWVALGIEPGSFLSAVLRNDLFDALGRADAINERCLMDWARFFYGSAPSNCYGSEDLYKAWIKRGGLIGKEEGSEK